MNNISTLIPQTTTLLVIDLQNDFVSDGGAIQVPGIKKELQRINDCISTCRSAGMHILYTKHIYSPEKNEIEALLFPDLADGGLRKDTWGTEIAEGIQVSPTDVQLEKPRYDAFFQTDLEKILENTHTTDVIIIGTMTEICCESTARGAMYRDYRVHMISDLNFTFSKPRHDATLQTIRTHFGEVLTYEALKKNCSNTTHTILSWFNS